MQGGLQKCACDTQPGAKLAPPFIETAAFSAHTSIKGTSAMLTLAACSAACNVLVPCRRHHWQEDM